jgi:cephalosporin hydroxylase
VRRPLRRPQPIASTPDEICDAFARLYYDREHDTWRNTTWLGVPVQKNPADLWVYQELLYEVRPDLIVETGTYAGGSALFLACICDILDNGRILSIDIDVDGHGERPTHDRITYVGGSSTDPKVVDIVRARAEQVQKVMVVLDSDHSAAHVAAELEAYAPLVTTGSFLIVEDTNVNGHPVLPSFGPGPMEALEPFLADDPRFQVDVSREKFLHTFNPRGFLRRVG